MLDANLNLKQSLLISSGFTALLWLLVIADNSLSLGLYQLGVYPQQVKNLGGVLLGPLIHGSWSHIAANSAPLIILGTGLLFGYPKSRHWALLIIWLGSGLGVWLFARDSYHYGASGLTHGLFFYLFIIGLLRRDKRSTVLLMIAFFLYGGMVASIFPSEPGISYEYHMAGALCGIASAVIFHKLDPLPSVKSYSWEQEDDSYLDEEPYWQEPPGEGKNKPEEEK